MKTKKQWDNSDLNFDKFVQPLDEISQDFYLHMMGVVCAQYSSPDFLQSGEPEFKQGNVYYYLTFSNIKGRYYYLGVLPEFLQ